jgi:hypothetical protein
MIALFLKLVNVLYQSIVIDSDSGSGSDGDWG